jgi:hypothetical protein
MKHQCQVLPEELGPYLLGQLDPDEEQRIAALVAECPSCTAEMHDLRPVVAALALTSSAAQPTSAATPAPPPDGFDGVLSTVHRERARRAGRSWRVAAAAAVVALVVGIGGTDDGRRYTLVGQGTARGSAVCAERDWGTAISLTVAGLQPGAPYGAWMEDETGDRVPAGTFTATSGGTMRLDLSARMALEDAAAVGVTRIDGPDVLRYDFF